MALKFDQDQAIPAGFVASTNDTFFLADAEGWTRHVDKFDDVFSVFHESVFSPAGCRPHHQKANTWPFSTTFEISYLEDTAQRQRDLSTIPERLEYIRERPWLEDHEYKHDETVTAQVPATIVGDKPDACTAPQRPQNASDALNEDATDSVLTEILPLQTNGVAHSQGARPASFPSRDDSNPTGVLDVNNTQSSDVAEMKTAFHAMMQPEQVTQGDTQTQGPFSGRRFASETTASPSRDLPSPLTTQSYTAPRGDARLELSQSAAERLESERESKKRSKPKSKSSKKKTQDVIACQCGYLREEGDMV